MSETTLAEKIRLSVIVPAYNLEAYLPETLDSLLSIRAGGPFEIIAVDDGSQDGTLRVLREYEAKDSRIRVFTGENGGVSRARNKGIDEARGRWLFFADGDDTVEPDFFAAAIDDAEREGYDLVQGNIRYLEENRRVRKVLPGSEYIPGGRLETRDAEELAELFFGRTETLMFSACAKLFRRELIGETRFPEGVRVAEDQKFVFDLLQKNPKVLILDRDAYNYIMWPTSVMHTGYVEKGWDAVRILEGYEETVESPPILRHIAKRKTDIYVRIYNTATATGKDPGKALQAVRGTDVRAIRADLTKKEWIKLVLLQRCRPLYNILLKVAG